MEREDAKNREDRNGPVDADANRCLRGTAVFNILAWIDREIRDALLLNCEP